MTVNGRYILDVAALTLEAQALVRQLSSRIGTKPITSPSLQMGGCLPAWGEETLREQVTRPMLSDGGRRVRVELDDFRPLFVFGPDQISMVQRL